MADFGKLPEKMRFGIVPAFALSQQDLTVGPKALYAALCTYSSPTGILFQSMGNLAKIFAVSKRQAQRWIYELEKSGLVVRIGYQGRAHRFLIIRNPEGINWAKSHSLKGKVERQSAFAKFGKDGAEARWKTETATCVSQPSDENIMNGASPAPPNHDLYKTNLTEIAWQEKKGGAREEKHEHLLGCGVWNL